jgi:hypothetical protein
MGMAWARCPNTSVSVLPAEAVPAPRPGIVDAEHNGRVVASQVIRFSRGMAHYRLYLPPGRYVINGPQAGPRRVDLRAGQTMTVNFGATCLLNRDPELG